MKERFNKREFCQRVFYDVVYNENTRRFETVKVKSTMNIDYTHGNNVAHCYISNERII